MLGKLLTLGAFAMAMAFMAGTAKADTLTYTQTTTFGTATAYLDVSTTATGGTATLTFGTDLNSYYTDSVGLQLGGGVTALASSSTNASGAWTFGNGNNANENSVCTLPGTGNWLCAKGPLTSLNGLSFTWDFTGSPTSPYSIQFAICNSNNCNTGTGGGFLTYFSQSGPVNTPEPSTLYLLGAGLLPLLFFGRRFLGDPDSR